MQIIWYGQSFFRILTPKGKNSQVDLVIDPFDEKIGLEVPSLETDILLITHHHHDHDNVKAIKGKPFLISGPGEYEIKEVFIQGIPAFHDNVGGKERGLNTIYTIETEEIRLCHLGDLGQKELTSGQLEEIGDIDILMIPVGGVYTISAKGASKIISQLEPKIVIPMHYFIPKLKIKLEGLNKFLKTMGVKTPEILKKFLIKKKNLPANGTKIIILKP
ncbi:MBL fold metallo-hydrolase [Patescibacteria group bacterium]|nr:MBL fold metallo-hydrolase [Patescibacteria group bacterium]